MRNLGHALFIGLAILLAVTGDGWRSYVLGGVAWSHAIIALTARRDDEEDQQS